MFDCFATLLALSEGRAMWRAATAAASDSCSDGGCKVGPVCVCCCMLDRSRFPVEIISAPTVIVFNTEATVDCWNCCCPAPVEINSAPTVVVFNTEATMCYWSRCRAVKVFARWDCYLPTRRLYSPVFSNAFALWIATLGMAANLSFEKLGDWTPGIVMGLLLVGRSSRRGPSVLDLVLCSHVACCFLSRSVRRRILAIHLLSAGWLRTSHFRPDACDDARHQQTGFAVSHPWV